jgi:cytochrome oxidase Cu insertion factor (SCO1/SenC/PrrC family)
MKIRSLALISISALLLTGCGSEMKHATTLTKPVAGEAAKGGGSYLDEMIPSDILSIPLFDQNGKTLTLDSLKGQYVVISNFLTSCQEICPMTTATMRSIGGVVSSSALKDKVKVLEISVDGERDNASRLAAYYDLYNDNTFSLASGTPSNLEKLWKYFGAPATKMEFTAKEKATLPVDWQTGKVGAYDMSHPDLVIIIGPDLHWKWLDLGNPNPGKTTIPEKLKAFLSEDGLGNLAKPQEPSWSADAVYSALHDLTGVAISQ